MLGVTLMTTLIHLTKTLQLEYYMKLLKYVLQK